MISPFDRQASIAGFTLIELLVVLAVISLLLAVVPDLTTGLSGVRFRSAARAFTIELRELQASAHGSGREITLAIDTRSRSWRSSLDPEMHHFPAVIDTVQVRFPDSTMSPPLLRFLPDGSASLAVLALGGSGRQAEIKIDGLTGRIRLDD